MRLVLLLWAAVSSMGVGKSVSGFVIHTSETFEDSYFQQNINYDIIHAEELLEKYGYLRCVPPGSEGNTGLHQVLLKRLRPTSSQTNQPLDFRLTHSPSSFNIPPPKSTDAFVSKKKWREAHMNYVWKRRLQDQKTFQMAPIPYSGFGESIVPFKKEKLITVKDPDDGTLHSLPVCSNEDIQKAIQKFQDTYHVGIEGGDLDSSTIALLSKPRCGNPDDAMPESLMTYKVSNGQLEENKAKVDSLQRKKRSLRMPRTGVGEDLESQHTPISLISVENKGPTTNFGADVPDQEYLKNKVMALREATRARHPQVKKHEEWEIHPEEAAKRRRRWLEDMVEKIHSGEEDARLAAITPHLLAKHRNKRSLFSLPGQQFSQNLITWRLVNTGYSSQLGKGVQRASLALAFRMWSEVIPRVFLEDNFSGSPHVDIDIGFGRRSHLGCVTEFDGLGGELSHALRDARDAKIHMDDDEHFTMDSEHGTNLLKVAVHEIGHVLGLGHVPRNYSIMYAIYEKLLPNHGLELGWDDRKLVQGIYGVCVGPFNTALDLLRWRSDGSLSYNTYFFRDNHFWMYENRYNRTRFGDPQYVTTEWNGLPSRIDGYAHIWTRTRDAHLFFKGENYYVYDPATGSVAPGYPRKISQDFHGPTTGRGRKSKTIPNNIDTVFFDKRDENLYFFKGRKVYGYDVSKGSSGCCLPGYPKLIRKEFVPSDRDSRSLPKDLDAAYYSYTDQTIFFIKDRLFWELVSFHPNDVTRKNEVIGPFYVHDKWYDICDTMLEPYTAYSLS